MSLWSVLCFQRNLEFALVEGTHRCLVPRVTQVHKHHIPGLLLRSRKILFINSICQCNWKKKKYIHFQIKLNDVNICLCDSIWIEILPSILLQTCCCLIHEPQAVEASNLSSIYHWSPLGIGVVAGNLVPTERHFLILTTQQVLFLSSVFQDLL